MEETELRKTIANNMTAYRKLNNLTQAEVAQRINYSDKSVSKWERAEGIPDVFVLKQLAEMYSITVSDLIGEVGETAQPPLTGQIRTRRYILLLSTGLVWLVATVAFAILSMIMPGRMEWWLAFIYAIPVSCIVLTVFANVWQCTYRDRLIASSGIIWGIALSLHLTFMKSFNIYLIYVIAAVFQAVWIIWHRYIMHLLRKK